MDAIKAFTDYRQTIGDRVSLYKTVADAFQIESALYPGSHIDIMPSFVIPNVVYIDNFKGTVKFFGEMETIMAYVEKHKQYDADSRIAFFEGDYRDNFDISPVDLIISQFAGFVGQDTKRFLKKGGILLCNDSHGDATLAFCDDEFEFIGTLDSNNSLEMENLERYFKFARDRAIDFEKVRSTMKGANYKIKAENYLFKTRL